MEFLCKVSGVKSRLKLFLVKQLSSISHSDSYRLMFNEVSGAFGERLFCTLMTVLLFRIFCSEPGQGSPPGLLLKGGKAGDATSAPGAPPAPGHLLFWFHIGTFACRWCPYSMGSHVGSPVDPRMKSSSSRGTWRVFCASLALIQLKVEVATGFCTTRCLYKNMEISSVDAINDTCRGKCWFEKMSYR